MPEPIQTKTMEEFQKEFKLKLYAALATAVLAGLTAVGSIIWSYVKTLPGPLGLVPSGAVVAFWSADNDEHSKACPSPGWSPLRQANGRVIVGAGKQDAAWRRYRDGEKEPTGPLAPFTFRKPLHVGGEEDHILLESEIPSHNHANGRFNILMMRDGQKTVIGSDAGGTPNLEAGEPIKSFGGDQAHNNMPPFIALYYCKKD